MSIVSSTSMPPHIFIQGRFPAAPDDSGRYQQSAQAYTIMERLANQGYTPEILEEFLDENPSFNLASYGRCEWNVLALAIDQHAVPLIHKILDLDPTLMNRCSQGERSVTYTSMAAETSVEILKIFYERGADINCPGGLGKTPLLCSLRYIKHIEATKFLLVRGGILYTRAFDLLHQIQNERRYQDGCRPQNEQQQLAHFQRAVHEIKQEVDYEVFCKTLHYHEKVTDEAMGKTYLKPRNPSFFSQLPYEVGERILHFVHPHHAQFLLQLK